MEYDDSDPEPIQGAFYASSSYSNPVFNYFREEELFNLTNLLKPLSEETEIAVLKDNNLEVIRTNPEFQTNKDHNRPTNRLCTALLSRDRLAFILRYALVYVAEPGGIQKHIMRYPQLFATKAIERKLNAGVKKALSGTPGQWENRIGILQRALPDRLLPESAGDPEILLYCRSS